MPCKLTKKNFQALPASCTALNVLRRDRVAVGPLQGELIGVLFSIVKNCGILATIRLRWLGERMIAISYNERAMDPAMRPF